MDNQKSTTIQIEGAVVDQINQMRLNQFIGNIKYQDQNLANALGELNNVRDFIAHPSHILGQDRTKFGEIAEHLEVAFKNADELIVGNPAPATFEGVGRTAPEDFLIDGLPVQSKFVQYHKSVDAILEHLNRYPDFIKNNGSYVIPKDHYEQIMEWLNLSPEELNKLSNANGGRTARAVIEKIRQFERQTGVRFQDSVNASQLNYSDVQFNPADIENSPANKSIDNKEKEIRDVDESRREEYCQLAKPSFKEGAKAACIAAAIDGVISFASTLIGKLNSGKKLNELTSDDWKDILGNTGIGVLRGGVSGGGIYALTNVAGMSAPFAASIVTATIGIVSQAIKLARGEISFDDFMYNILGTTVEAAVSGVGAAIGQVLIPVPVVGAIIGSLVSTTVLRFIKNKLLGGGYYKLVNDAGYEAAFAECYRPLAEAYYYCSAEYELCVQDCIAYRDRIIIIERRTDDTLDKAEDSIKKLKDKI